MRARGARAAGALPRVCRKGAPYASTAATRRGVTASRAFAGWRGFARHLRHFTCKQARRGALCQRTALILPCHRLSRCTTAARAWRSALGVPSNSSSIDVLCASMRISARAATWRAVAGAAAAWRAACARAQRARAARRARARRAPWLYAVQNNSSAVAAANTALSAHSRAAAAA